MQQAIKATSEQIKNCPRVSIEENQYKEGKLYMKKMVVPEGKVVLTHSHKYDHYSILAKGVAAVVVDGEIKQYEAGDQILIKADEEHQIHALTEIVWFCIHVSDVEDLTQIDETLIA